MRRVLCGASVAVVILGLASSAFADTTAELGDHLRVDATWRDVEQGAPKASDPVHRSTEPFLLRTVFDYYLNMPCPGPDNVIGAVRYSEINPAAETERILNETLECVPVPRLPPDGDGPEQAIPPPRVVDVRDAVSELLPTPVFAGNPDPEGLTGLATWLWYEDDGASALQPVSVGGTTRPGLSVTATAGPYSITATAWIVQYRWDTGDGARYVSTASGSLARPAASHVYETKGDYTIRVEAVWAGSYTWTAGGRFGGSGDLGSVVRSSSHPYTVVEARTVLTR
jgi:hypothetical protein